MAVPPPQTMHQRKRASREPLPMAQEAPARWRFGPGRKLVGHTETAESGSLNWALSEHRKSRYALRDIKVEHPMPERNSAALEFLLTRRSRPAKTLGLPVPDKEQLQPVLTAAARTPDHGKLEPWRFIVVEQGAMARLADTAERCARASGLDEDQVTKARSQFDQGNLAVAVVEVRKPSEKIPALEQTYSAGAACLALLNAALAAGWGANWLSGWASHDRTFMSEAFGLSDGERIAGLIHIGTESSTPPDRPRPDLSAITQWVDH